MEYVLMAVCFVGAVAAMILIKSLELSGGLTAALVAPLIVLVIYSMARIQAKYPESLPEEAKK